MLPSQKFEFFAQLTTRTLRIFSALLIPINNTFILFQGSVKTVLKANREHNNVLDRRNEICTEKDHSINQAVDIREISCQHDRTVTAIMDVIESFSLHNLGDGFQGRAVFSPRVKRHIAVGRKIRMVLPAFPAKSINCAEKVLGPLPDLGEELALARLNDLCKCIQRVYSPGATVLIATDGPCYNDLTGVLVDNLWEYGAKIREMAVTNGYTCIEFIDTVELLGLHDDSEMTKAKFIDLLEPARKELERRYGDPNFSASACIKNDPDYKMTYDGYAKFLKKDLAHGVIRSSVPSGKKYKAYVHETAKAMIARGVAFSKLIREKYPDHVRLSIHPSTGRTKISIPLIPTDSFSMTPWHSVVVVDEHGNFRTTHTAGLRATHDLVYKNGRPYHFRTRSSVYQFDAKVEFEHLYGRGLIIHNAEGEKQTRNRLGDSDKEKIALLAILQGYVELKGFL